MVEQVAVSRRTLKDLAREAIRVDRTERKAARKVLKAHGYSALDALNPDVPAPSELYMGHEWTLQHVGEVGRRSTVSITCDTNQATIGINNTGQGLHVEIPLKSHRRPGKGATETNGSSRPLTEATALKTKKILQELATSKR